MTTPAEVPLVVESHERLRTWLIGLDPVDPGRPSELPDWTVGHVMTHLARNADSFTGMLSAAALSEERAQYPGGLEQRAADIEAGARRSWEQLVADVVEAGIRLDMTMDASTDAVWHFGTGDLMAIPHRRLREVEIHRLDLGLGATWVEWPDDFVDTEWPNSVARLGERLPDGVAIELAVTGEPPELVGNGGRTTRVSGSRTELLAWITGRRFLSDAPELAPWP